MSHRTLTTTVTRTAKTTVMTTAIVALCAASACIDGDEPAVDGADLDPAADQLAVAGDGQQLADEVLHTTRLVRAGETFDGHGRRYRAGRELGDGSQDEDQKPMFKLENGARLRNVILGAPAADGVHTYGNATLDNVIWEDIGEDALTVKRSGAVAINGGSAAHGDDKVFQVNAASTLSIRGFRATGAGKLVRQNGGTTFRVDIVIDGCDISHMGESIARTDSSQSTVRMTNSRYRDIGDALFIGFRAANITTANNREY